MKFSFIEEVSPRLTQGFEDEMHCMVGDERIFIFPLSDQSARERSAKMNLVLQLKRIFTLFAFNTVSKNRISYSILHRMKRILNFHRRPHLFF